MNAIEKMDAFGIKELATATGRNLVTIYRWRAAIASGEGVSDKNKRALIEATTAASAPITYADFLPREAAAPAPLGASV